MTKRMLLMLGGLLLLVLLLAGGFALHIKNMIAGFPKPTPHTVSTTVVRTEIWQLQVLSVGTISAVRGVDLSSEIAGLVSHVHFKSGQDVKAGTVLVQLNADSEIAQLSALQASAELSAITLKRNQAQLAIQAISQAQVDNDKADLKNKMALVAGQTALIQKKTIRAPFAGRVGISTINPGQYLNPGDKIVSLQTINPIYVEFYVPQRQIGLIAKDQIVKATSDAFADQTFNGKITAINPKVDPTTRNLQVEATIANAEGKLLPGMFVNTVVNAGETTTYLTLPQTAITYNPYGSTVFVVKKASAKKDKDGQLQPAEGLDVKQVFVKTGETRGDQVAIISGLQAGQQVVTSGQVKLKNDTPVVINNSVQPKNSSNPTPQED